MVAIILSAGESSRMGSPKALLPMQGISFIERIISELQASKVGMIVVVLGHNAEAIRVKIQHLPVTVVVNQDYARGQLSSLCVGLRSLEAGRTAGTIDGALVHLVDHPFLTASLVDYLIDRFYDSQKLVVLPRYKGKRGHPVIFSSRLFAELESTPLDQGAKAVVHAHRDETLEIEVEDEGVVIDIDTPEEYGRYAGTK